MQSNGREGVGVLSAERVAAGAERISAPTVPTDRHVIAGTPLSATGSRRRRNHLRRVLVAGDAAAAGLSWVVVLALVDVSTGDAQRDVLAVVAGVLVVMVTADVRGLYLARVSSVRSIELARLASASVLGAIAGVFTLLAGGRNVDVDGLVAVAAAVAVVQFGLLGTLRSVFDDWLKQRRLRGEHCRPLLLFGFDDDLARLLAILREQPELGYRVVGYVGPAAMAARYNGVAPPRVGDFADAVDLVGSRDVSGVVVAAGATTLPSAIGPLEALLRSGARVQVSPGLRGIDARRVRTLPIAHEPLLYIEPMRASIWRDPAKRLADLLLAPVLFALTAPVLLVAALAIKLDDGGPILFRQERVGRHGRTFTFLKLRTMTVGAHDQRDALADRNLRGGPLFKVPDDPRVTRVGRILRALSIDELPQLWNVVRGDMALVGPRPALPSEVEAFDDELLRRHEVRPGITGLWQVEARDNPSFAAYRRLDVFYVDNWSLSLDLVLLVLTVHAVALRAVHAIGRLVLRAPATVGSLD